MFTIRTILHPTDLSESAGAATRLAVRLAREHGARLIAVHVADPPVFYGEMGMTIPLPELQAEILKERRDQLETLVAGTGAECRVEQGATAPEVLRVAREASCDLIVMGTHGRGGVARAMLGSVAEAVLRRAPCPVLAVKPSADRARAGEEGPAAATPGAAGPPFPVILHPTDFSGRSRHALEVARTLARGGGRLVVLHVVEAVHVASAGYEDALHERLRELQPEDPSFRVEYRLREGESSEEILREAAASSCDLIALGTHGRTGLDRLMMGSVAEAVLRRAACPVLVVKSPAHATSPDTPSPLATTAH